MLDCLKPIGDKYFANLKEETLAYLLEKYGKEFEIEDMTPVTLDNTYDEVLCRELEEPREQFHVFREPEDDGFSFVDNYYGVVVKDEYAQLLGGLIVNGFESFNMEYRFLADYFDDKYTQDYPLCEAVKETPEQFLSDVAVLTALDSESAKKAFDKVCGAIREKGLEVKLRVFVVPQLITDSSVYDYLYEKSAFKADFEALIR